MMVHPAGARPARRSAPSPSSSSTCTYHGRAAHAAAAPAGRPQRARRRRPRLHERRRPPPAHPPRRAHPRHLHRGRRGRQHRARPGPRRSGTSARRQLRGLETLKDRVLDLPRGRRRRPPAARWTTSGATRPTPTWSTTSPSWSTCTRENAGPDRPDAARPGGGRRLVGSTDMGNVSHLVPSIHPMIAVSPAHVAIHTADFVALRRRPRRATGRCSTGPRPWPARWPTCGSTRRPDAVRRRSRPPTVRRRARGRGAGRPDTPPTIGRPSLAEAERRRDASGGGPRSAARGLYGQPP